MTKLYITEFTGMQSASGVGHAGESAPVVSLPSLGTQTITPGDISTQSAALNASTRIVRIKADIACHIVAGESPTATSSDMSFEAGAVEYFGVRPGSKIAAVKKA